MSLVSPRGRDLAIWIAVFTLITLLSLALRLYIVLRIARRKLRIDDYLMFISVSGLLAMEGTTFWGWSRLPAFLGNANVPNSDSQWSWCSNGDS